MGEIYRSLSRQFFRYRGTKRIKNYFYFKFVSLEAEEFIFTKEILSGSQSGKDKVKKMIDDIVKQLKQEDYEDYTGEIETRMEPKLTPQNRNLIWIPF